MTVSRWNPLPTLAEAHWVEARLAVHWAAQIPAAFADSYLPAAPDLGHSALSWSPELRALVTGLSPHALPLRAGLRIADLALLLLDGSGRVLASHSLIGFTLDEGIEWLREACGRALGTNPGPMIRPELTLPDHPVASGDRFSALPESALLTLEAWFHNAYEALKARPADLAGRPPLRVWPHHFDAATLYPLDEDAEPDEAAARSLGLGFSPGDGGHPLPYWYVLPWPAPELGELPELSVGRWETDAYVGTLSEARDRDEVLAFFAESVRVLRPLLARIEARKRLVWYRAATLQELPEGRVKSVVCGRKTVCLTHHDGQYGALDNRCPHQGGPLGEGSIEKGVLRCPWHGWDYDPLSGRAVGYDDGVETFPVEQREDGIYVGIEPPPKPKTTYADIIAQTMTRWGIDTVFGMVGHSNLGMAEALRLEAEAGRLSYFGIRHEGAASFAASAYAKLTGRPAACLSIAGPGATNLLTGLWDANVDRAPVLALTGQVDTQVLGPGAFQEIDLKAAYGGVAQWSQPVLQSSRPAELVNLALRTAILNRGVSHLILPDEVQTMPAADGSEPGSPEGRLPSLGVRPPPEALDRALTRLREVKRPAFIVGHGARFHMAEIIALAEQLGVPVLTTFKGKGLIPDDHPLACGVLGRSGTPIASWFMNEAELLVVFGASFSNHTGISSYKPSIQIDFEPTQLARFHPISVPLLGEIGETTTLLQEGLHGRSSCLDHRPEVAERWRLWRAEKASREADHRGQGLNSAQVFAALGRHIPKDGILPVDVGNNTYSFGRYFEASGQAVLMSGYLGSIGFALPAAMGAWAATRGGHSRFTGRKVVSISGDGGLGQYLGEITTLVKYDMNITHVVLNNSQLGKISKEQRSGEWPVWQTSLVNPDFAAFAESCGARGFRVSAPDQLDQALTEAIGHTGPALVEIVTDAELV